MSYQVLARQWRPRSFADMVGQEHVVTALTNALTQQRLHHGYLFSGTRGVGKTTVARILAKCLNCETGITPTPCGQCHACQAIEQGSFVDLIEVDAASRTKVEDTRSLLESVQYAPNQGRFKIYLIDEVHMLSGHSFNALLKTLEEPPEHVKFLLATTDPQKLPITVLSRCLQFHLKNLLPEQISPHLAHVLEQEKIPFEQAALTLISQAADGSLRDALSLLDQAIGYGDQQILEADVRKMLGTLSKDHLLQLLSALVAQNATALIHISKELASYGADFKQSLSDLISALHQISLQQLLPDYCEQAELASYTQQISPEDVQLYYQIGLQGKNDLSLAPSPRIGFEMTLLRMLAFRPFAAPQQKQNQVATTQEPSQQLKPEAETKQQIQTTELNPTGVVKASLPKVESSSEWGQLLAKLSLTGLTHTLASHCVMTGFKDNILSLDLPPEQSVLLNDTQLQRMQQALTEHFGRNIKCQVNIVASELESPAAELQRLKAERQDAAEQAIHNDPNVQQILSTFDATIITDSINPND